MRLAIFSDVHGNLAALQAVLEHIDRQPDIDQIIFAGDLCLFGPRPQACIDLIRQRPIATLAGNTDEWIRQAPLISDNLEPKVAQWLHRVTELSQWTEEQLDAPSLTWIDQLRLAFSHRLSPTGNPADELLIVHANPLDLMGVIFPGLERQRELYGKIRQNDDDLALLLAGESAGVIAFGHLHIPGVRLWRDKTLVNISSVSIPGDGDGRAKYAVLSWTELGGWTADHHHVSFSVEEEITAFRQSRPPGWETKVENLMTLGFVPQVI